MNDFAIRDASHADAGRIAEIYNRYILESTATFDTEPKSVAERRAWLDAHDAEHPVLVASVDGVVAGWGALTRWAERPGWSPTAEISVYVDPDMHGRGIGSALMGALLERAADSSLRAVIGQVVAGNEPSIELARRHGFEQVGMLREVGRKFDQALDVVLLEHLV